MAIFLPIWLKDIIYNVPPGVIDSPGLCDTDHNQQQQQQQQQQQEQQEQQEE